jgi:hypothetical protein
MPSVMPRVIPIQFTVLGCVDCPALTEVALANAFINSVNWNVYHLSLRYTHFPLYLLKSRTLQPPNDQPSSKKNYTAEVTVLNTPGAADVIVLKTPPTAEVAVLKAPPMIEVALSKTPTSR